MWQWAEENNWGSNEKQRLETFVQQFLIIPYDVEIAKAWARLNVHCKKIGRRLEAGDAWIAAAAIRFNLPLLNHDRDFIGLNHQQLHLISYL
ncbi:MAG TPA: PIN domain-containing protein [Blastocatellia bacterium]|nr:PIN domain-containing protein [Blastocatellia bacterium]